jgi:alpha-glucosidase/alpha-D-xyloside xylohydrolase
VDLETIPLYVKAGAVLPRGPVKQYVSEISHEPMTLTIYPGADGGAVLYEDDGASFAYQRGDFLRTELRWNDARQRLTLKHVKGRKITKRMFRIGLAGKEMREVHYDGEWLDLQL